VEPIALWWPPKVWLAGQLRSLQNSVWGSGAKYIFAQTCCLGAIERIPMWIGDGAIANPPQGVGCADFQQQERGGPEPGR